MPVMVMCHARPSGALLVVCRLVVVVGV